MNITDVRIREITGGGKMKAVVSITLDDEFVVHDIKIIDGKNGLFIAMPSRKMNDGEFRDIAHPIVSEVRNMLRDTILASYAETLKSLENSDTKDDSDKPDESDNADANNDSAVSQEE